MPITKTPSQKSLKLYIKTFGCQMNEYDSAKLAHLMHITLGFVLVNDINLNINADDADSTNDTNDTDITHATVDLIVFNTCSVREKAQEKLFSELGILRKLKHRYPNLVIAVGGCVATQEKANILKRAPHVDIIFGPQTWQRLPAMYQTFIATHTRIVDTEFSAQEKFSCLDSFSTLTANHYDHHYAENNERNGRNESNERSENASENKNTKTTTTAYVAIMEGCNKFCSYCIVPYTRGREISRSFAEIMREIRALTMQGVKEVCFLGQNVNNYRDLKYSDNCTANLATLIHATAELPSIVRIRFITSHPAHFDDELIAIYANENKLAAHLHLPVQSGSNRILRAMRRTYTHERYRDIVSKLRRARPEISITSDFIVGFPGEDDEDFAATMDLVNAIGFDHSFSFIYSPRPGTQAASMKDDVPLHIKKQRLQILQQALNAEALKISEGMVGSVQKIIVTSTSKKNVEQLAKQTINQLAKTSMERITATSPSMASSVTPAMQQLAGRTENNRIVNFIASTKFIGQVVNIKITKVLTNSLLGEMVDK